MLKNEIEENNKNSSVLKIRENYKKLEQNIQKLENKDMSYNARKMSQQIVVEDFDEDKEDMLLKKQMRQRFDVTEKFKDLYKNKLSG